MLRDAQGRSYLDLGVVTSASHSPEPRRPEVLLFLDHRRDISTAPLCRIDAGAAIMGLLRNTPHTWSTRPALVKAFALAAASAAAYQGFRGEAEVAWATVLARLTADGLFPRRQTLRNS